MPAEDLWRLQHTFTYTCAAATAFLVVTVQRTPRKADDTLEGVELMTHTGGNSDDPMRIGGVGRTRRPDDADAVASVEADATQGVEASSGASAPGDTEAIAQALASGAIDADQARAQLVEQMVRAQLPADADPALVAEIQTEVEALLEGDPLLDALLRPT
jgi:hypothetical protein